MRLTIDWAASGLRNLAVGEAHWVQVREVDLAASAANELPAVQSPLTRRIGKELRFKILPQPLPNLAVLVLQFRTVHRELCRADDVTRFEHERKCA